MLGFYKIEAIIRSIVNCASKNCLSIEEIYMVEVANFFTFLSQALCAGISEENGCCFW